MASSVTRSGDRKKSNDNVVVLNVRIEIATEPGRGTNRHAARNESRHQLKIMINGTEHKPDGSAHANKPAVLKRGKAQNSSLSKFASKSRRQGKEDEEKDGDQFEQEVDDGSESDSVSDEDDDQPDADGAQVPVSNDDEERNSKASGGKKELASAVASSRKSGRSAQPSSTGGNGKKGSQAEKSNFVEAEPDSDEEKEDEEKHEIESIVYHQVTKGKPTDFLIKWVGCDEDEETWMWEDEIQHTLAYEQYCAKHDVTVKSERQLKEEAAAKRKAVGTARGSAKR